MKLLGPFFAFALSALLVRGALTLPNVMAKPKCVTRSNEKKK